MGTSRVTYGATEKPAKLAGIDADVNAGTPDWGVKRPIACNTNDTTKTAGNGGANNPYRFFDIAITGHQSLSFQTSELRKDGIAISTCIPPG